MHSLYLRIWQWIIPLTLLAGCSRPVALEHDRLKPIHFGKPEVQGGILTIPVLTNEGHCFFEIWVLKFWHRDEKVISE